MFSHEYSEGEVLIEPFQCSCEVSRSNGVKLCSGFIEDKELWLHNEYRCKIEELFLSARKLSGIPVEPVIYAEIACHFRNTAVYLIRLYNKIFKTESQFVPHLVGNYLLFGTLCHETHRSRGSSVVKVGKSLSAEAYLTAHISHRSKLTLHHTEQS